ncbi:MAG: STAS domain-containing protein [Methanoregula sp.]|nr:STAS domain-containing protein [Methanoregula sp.]MDD5024171.1 STAS domain-containing protein [Methanoregula sp.]MDD5188112.1 STAS domain-containing protein [Methanoregula sp.]
MNSRIVESATVVEMPDRLDSNIANTVEKELNSLVNNGQITILCDFSRTKYLSSAGLRVLFGTFKKTKALNGRFGVFSLSPYVREIFDVSGFSGLIPIFQSESAAIKNAGEVPAGR